MSECGALRIQKFLIDGVVKIKVMRSYAIPKLRGIFFTEKHYCFSCSSAQIVCFFYAVDEEIMHVFVLVVKLDELIGRVGGKVECEAPGEGWGVCVAGDG